MNSQRVGLHRAMLEKRMVNRSLELRPPVRRPQILDRWIVWLCCAVLRDSKHKCHHSSSYQQQQLSNSSRTFLSCQLLKTEHCLLACLLAWPSLDPSLLCCVQLPEAAWRVDSIIPQGWGDTGPGNIKISMQKVETSYYVKDVIKAR